MRPAVLILNKDGWQDTIECLESVLRSKHSIRQVVLCDNASTDGSVDRVIDWAEGRLSCYVPPDNPLRALSFPPIGKPIDYRILDREEAESDGDQCGARMTIVRNGANLGFAGGNNVGLRYLLSKEDWDCVWILNPDTAVRPEALGALCEALSQDGDAGICGGTLFYYSDPNVVQAMGGAEYNKWLALPRHIGAGLAASAPIDMKAVISRMVYVYGASMLVSRRFIEQVGLMNEDRFLYFEELDWAMRARGRFRLAYAPESIVYHREGSSLGSGREKSRISDYYFLRNRIRVTRDYTPYALPTVYLAIMAAALRRAYRRQWDRALMAAKLLWTA